MKKTTLIAFLLAMLAPMTQVWAGSNYYAALKTTVKSGSGKVYAAKSSTAEGGRSYDSSSSSATGEATSTSGGNVSGFYAYAKPDTGWKFVKWTNTSGTTLSTSAEYGPITLKASTTDKGTQTTEYWAYFEKEVLASFNITFETSSAGSYTVDGAAPANKTGLTEATSVTLKSTDSNFLNWVVNGTDVTANPYTASCTANTTISAVFLTADMVTSVTTFSDLTSALSNAQYKKVIVSSGTEITIPSGTTVTVPSGKQLVVDGTIWVLGSMSNSGAISGSGAIAKVTKTVTQGAVVTPANTYTNYPAYKYQNTTIASRSVSISGTTPGCTVKWGVELAGDKCYALASEPDILVCSIDQSIAKNHITSINSSSSAFTHQGGSSFNGNTMILLTKNTTMSLNDNIKDSKGYLGFQGMVDCAGYKLTLGSEAKSNFYLCYFNGKFQSTTCVNIKVTAVNSTDMTIQSWNAKSGNNSARFIFYDHNGTCSWSKSASGETTDMIFFYSGTFTSSLTYEDMMCIHGGAFKTDPKNYLFDSDNYKTEQENSYYVVKRKIVASTDPVATVNGTQFVNFVDAVSAAKGTGYPIVLIEKAAFDETLTIGAGTNITIRLDEHTLECSKIINRGNLQIEDARADNKGTINAPIDNYGVLDIAFGTYSGKIVNYAGGVFTAHNGMFEGGVTRSGGTINYKGGRFPTDTAVTLMNGYGSTVSDGKLCVFEWPNSDMVSTTFSGHTGWSVTPYSTTDFALLRGYDQNAKTHRSDYSSSGDWQRVAELLAFYDIYKNVTLDASVAFDRDVGASSITLYGKTTSLPVPTTPNYTMVAGSTNRLLSAAMIGSGQATAALTYSRLFTDNISSVSLAIENSVDGNFGTVYSVMVELWSSVRGPGYTTSNPVMITNTVAVLSYKRMTFGAGSNKAMIRPATGAATFYATPEAAMAAATDGGTVMLANDCTTGFSLTNAGTYTFDTMGFAYSGGEPSLGANLFIKSSGAVDSAAKVLVPDAVATKYVVAQMVAQVGEQGYETFPEAFSAALSSGSVLTLLADTDYSTSLAKGQSLKLALASGVTYSGAITSSNDKYIVSTTPESGYTLYKTVYNSDEIEVESEGNVVGYKDLAAALATVKSGDKVTVVADVALNDDATIPYGATLVVSADATLTIASGKTLWIDGDATINGTISGTYSKCTKLIYQEGENGEPFCPYKDDDRHNKDDEFVIKYWKTKVKTLSSLTGASSHTTIQNGYGVVAYHGAAASGAFVCKVDKSKAINHITEVISAQASATDAYNTFESSIVVANQKPYIILLTANGSVSVGNSVNISKCILVDGASAYSMSFSGQQVADMNLTFSQGRQSLTFVNCTSATSPKLTDARATFINCSGTTTVGQLNANTATYMTSVHIYDSPLPSISFASGAKTLTSVGAGVCVFSGGAFSVSTGANYHYYGGYYSADPSSRLYDTNYVKAEKGDPNKGENANYWYIKPVLPTVYVAQVGSEQFETVQDAVDAAGNNGGTVELLLALATDGLAEPITVAAGKTVTIDLKGLTINAPNGAFINNGTLYLKDTSTGTTPASITTENGNLIVNNGTMDVTYGTYNGNILLNDGIFTTHGGTFTGTLTAATGKDPKVVANLRGGSFSKSVTAFLRDGYVQHSSYVGEYPFATPTDTTLSGAAKAWKMTIINSADSAIYNKKNEGSWTEADWKRYAELVSRYTPYGEYTPEGIVVFDRAVSGGTISLYAEAKGSNLPTQTPPALSSNEVYPFVIAASIESQLGKAYTYKQYLSDVNNLSVGVGSTSANNGTVCTLQLQFWQKYTSTEYHQTSGLEPLVSVRYMLGGKKAAIDRGANRLAYDSLAAAVAAAESGERILIGADCSENVTLPGAGTFTVDPYGFAFTGTVSIPSTCFLRSQEEVASSATAQGVTSAKAVTYNVALKVAQVGETFYDKLTEAVAAANGAVVKLWAATDETITLTTEGQSFTLNKNGVEFDDAKVVTTIENGSVTVAAGESGTVYTAVTTIVDANDGNKYNSVTDAVANVPGNDISVTVTANDTESVELPQGKSLTVTTAPGVTANLNVTPADGAFLVESEVEGGTKYESKKITVEMAEPSNVASVEMEKIENGNTNTVSDTSLVSAAVAALKGNVDVPRTDNTDKLDVLDVITVTPTKIVQEVVGAATIIRSATFDVVPTFQTGKSLGEGQKLKFRLPVDAAATQLAAIIYHNGAQFGIYPVQTYNNEKFVEVESDAFSPYGYTLLDGETDNPVAAIGTTGYATLNAALTAAVNGDTIYVFAGTFDIGSDTIVVNKEVTITGAGKDTTTLNSTATGKAAFSIQASNVTIEDMTINQADTSTDNTHHISVVAAGSDSCYSNVTISNLKLGGGKYSMIIYGESFTIDGCDFASQGSSQILVDATKGDSRITNNTFTGGKYNVLQRNSHSPTTVTTSGKLTICDNTSQNGNLLYILESASSIDTTQKMELLISGNEVANYTNKAIALTPTDELGKYLSAVTITGNAFHTTTANRPAIQRDDSNTTTLAIDASANYWGDSAPDFDNPIQEGGSKYLIMPHTDSNNIVVDSYGTTYTPNSSSPGATVNNLLYKVSFVDADGTTILYETNLASGNTPVYGGTTPTKAATAQYTFTWVGWTYGGNTYGTADTLAPVADAAQTYTATYSSVVNDCTVTVTIPANSTITVKRNGAAISPDAGTDNAFTVPYGTELTVEYAASGAYIAGGTQSQVVTADSTKTVAAPNDYSVVPAVAQIGSTYYPTLAAAIAAANATAGSDTVTIMILQASVTTGDSTITHNVFIDTELAGGATINFNGSSFTARGGAVVTFADDVAALGNVVLAVDGGSPAVSDAKLVLSNNVQALYMMPNVSGGEICIEPSARVSINNDYPIYFATGKVTVNGNLAAGKGLTATSAEIAGAQQLTGGYMFLYFGNNTVELNDTYATSLYVDPYTAYWISAYGSSVAFNLNNSTLYLGNPLGENGGKGFNMGGLGTMTMVGSRLIANGTVTLNSGDVVNMSGKSAITAAAFGNSGVINVDVSTIAETDLPFTIITVTGGGTVTPGAINLTNIPDDKGYVVSVDGNKIALEKAVASITSGEPVVTNYFTTLAYAVAAAEAQTPEPTIRVYDTSAAVPEGWHLVTEGGITTLVRTTFYNVWVGGTQITSANAADVFGNGKVSYDDATKTLTLNGYTYSGAGYGSSAVYIGDMGGVTFNIVVAGENSLTSTATYGYAIRSVGTGAVTVTGSGANPSLALTVPSTYDTGYAVSVKGTSATFKDLSMEVTGYLGIVVNGTNAAGDALTIDNCDIVFDGTAIDQAIWVYNEGGDGTVSIENGSSLTGKGAILVYGYGTSAGDANLSITDSTVNLTGATSANSSSRHAIEVLSKVGDSVLTIDNSTVTVTASNGLNPDGNGPDGINVGSQNSVSGKGLAKIDIKNGSVVTATGNANGVNLFTWGSSGVNQSGAELSVVDSTLNASATHETGGHYGIVAYAYQKGDTAVVFENSTVNASAPATAAICLGAGEKHNDKVGNVAFTAEDSAVTMTGPYGLLVSTISEAESNTDSLQTVDISGGSFTCNGLLFVYGDDGENTASVSMSGVTAQIGTTAATGEPVSGTITTGAMEIDSGDYTVLHGSDLDAFDVSDGDISGGTFNEKVPEDLCADSYIPTELDPVTGKYTVKTGAFVARNMDTGTGYETLFAAVRSASAGDTIALLDDVVESITINKDLTLTGAYTITGTLNIDETATVALEDITLDANGTIYALNISGGSSVAVDNVTVGGGTWCNIHLNNGTLTGSGLTMLGEDLAVEADGQHYTYRGERLDASETPPFGLDVTKIPDQTVTLPFMDIVRENGTDTVTLSGTLTQGASMLFVANMPGDETQTGVTLPARFGCYSVTLGESLILFGDADTPVMGWGDGGWNEVIDTGAAVLEALDKDSDEVPVELTLNGDVDLGNEPFEFKYENLTIDGNGNAVSGTIKYTDDAGVVSNIVLGTESAPLTLDMSGVTNPIELGSGVAVSNVTINMTAAQATAGTPIVIWDTENAEAPANEAGVTVAIVTAQGEPTGDNAELIWDDELGVAYIGPCEARLTGPTHEQPIYTTLADAIAWAADSGDTVTLMTNIVNYTGTVDILKSLTIDGAGHSISAAPVPADGHRNMFSMVGGSTSMLKIHTGTMELKNITLDGDATHRYTYLVDVANASSSLTTENIRLLNGGELDASGTPGAGYGAGIHLNNAALTVKDGFYACTGGPTDGVFPFTGILPEGDYASVTFALTDDTDANPTVAIGNDLLLVGMIGAIDPVTAQGILDYMKVPSRFIPYTLTLGDGTDYAFTGASPRTWNEIIDYGKDIMEVSTSLGYTGLDTASTPVEVGLLTDTVLPDTFTFADTNFTVNGNGNALSGTIKYTDNAGLIEDIVMGTEGAPLVLDVTEVTQPIEFGAGVAVTNVTIQMTEAQATAGTPVVIWDAAGGVDAPANEDGVTVTLVDEHGDPTGDEADLIWDDELGLAYIGPCEARLTGPTHEQPIYTSLAHAIELAEASGDTVTLMTNIVNFTGTQDIFKSLTFDGAGHSISAAPVPADGHRNMFSMVGGSTSMLKIHTGTVELKNITLDGDATHRYTYLVSADNASSSIVTENVRLLHGGEIGVDSDGTTITPGNGYGAAIHLNNASLTVKDGFYACTGTNENGVTTGVFPFTAILPEGNSSVLFDLTGAPNDPANVDIGDDLLLVGMIGAIPLDQVQGILDYMQVPSRFIPYTLTLGDGSSYAFTGASPRTWNEIIDYGKDIMDVATANGLDGLDKVSTPVEVGLLTDTVLPGTFTFADTNFTVNGNGNALSGTIEYTDNAGLIEDIVMGTETDPLILDMTGVTQPVEFGAGIAVTNVTIKMTEDQATAGTPVVIWDVAGGVDAPANEAGVTVAIVDDQGTETGDTAELIWDDELGLAYIGPCEARLTGPTHESPIYTSLASAIALAADSGDTVTLMMDIENFTGTQMILNADLVLDGAGHKITAAPVSTHRDIVNAWSGSTAMFKLQTGDITFRDITLDGDATHAYTFLISADNSSVHLTTENIKLLNGGELCGDANGAVLEEGAGYGAAIHINNGAAIVVSNGFYACTGGKTAGVFPFTGILVDTYGGDVKFELTGNPNDPNNVDIGNDLLLVGMVGDLVSSYGIDAVQDTLDEMKVPSRFIPYTLTLGDGSAYAFTGASPLGWNAIIDYGKEIMEVSTDMGYSGLDKDTTPVEVGLLTDTVLPTGTDGYDFLYEDSNFSINGNGNVLSGTIKFTDDAEGGLITDTELGTNGNPLTLDLSETDYPVVLGGDVVVSNVVVKLTEDQAELGKIVFEWDSGETPPDDEQGVEVTVVNDSGVPTGETKGLVWDEEYGVAYIGPCEARLLTGTAHNEPIYTTLANALTTASDGDSVQLLTNVVMSASRTVGVDVTLDLKGYEISVNGDKGIVVTDKTLVITDSHATNGVIRAGDGASPASLIEAGNGGTVNIQSGIFEAASGGTALATSDTGAFAVSGGYFSNEVLPGYCAANYAPTTAEAGSPQPYTVAKTVNEFRYPIDGTAGVPVSKDWLAQNLSDIYSDSTQPVFESITNDLVQALSANGANGMPLWESYVLGLDPTDSTAQLRLTARPKDATTVTILSLIDRTKFPQLDGTTVKFRLAKRNNADAPWTDVVKDYDEPSFDQLLEDVAGKELAIFADIVTE